MAERKRIRLDRTQPKLPLPIEELAQGKEQRPPLRLPEYGRLVQQMAERALNIPDRARRQAYAARIVRVMAHRNPKQKNNKEYINTLWDHLAYITDYQLDIDYPCVVHRKEEGARPRPLPYPKNRIRYRHYGHLVEAAIESVVKMPPSQQRNRLLQQVATRMKRNLAAWKGDGVSDDKVKSDLEAYALQMKN